ncbi:hypothetical protein JYP49_06980 [Nitratireductor aquimarinus]|uniref:hypothetical protein n=1 Tax=Nitratireductor TaxID=245876 RepID=UPI0019D3B0DC|nr:MULTISPECIES: hypothetical protein [Nitratireductor]MBN7776993.1 hypothetical protein [Nitratireductor pacificus]MBN7780327.1 hypothetical protein [Nitratireductor pacificus]MBN7789134.1 hypothetical protein [Nitratireductor aquimarinus]MBY6099202.1 hypothetical protein [Nitratireductor aquimarinus]MCA1261900.1 hypothetical protein [Nitratireductor aquimarinus]
MRPALAAIRRALPAPATALLGALLWGALMGLNAFAFFWQSEWQTAPRVTALTVIFALGGVLAFPLGHTLQALIARHGRPEQRFAAAFLAFALCTLCITAALYALEYRAYYAQWHGPILSLRWAFEFVFTIAGALYQFAVLGLRIYFPWGLAALFALSLAYAVKPR